MWHKAEDNKPQPCPNTSPSPVPSLQRPADAAAPVSPSAPAYVSQGIRINGEFSGSGDLCLDGTFKRERVQVSSTGRVTGDMETHGIVVEDGAVLRSKVQGRQEEQPAQLSPRPVAPRAKEAAAAGGAQDEN